MNENCSKTKPAKRLSVVFRDDPDQFVQGRVKRVVKIIQKGPPRDRKMNASRFMREAILEKVVPIEQANELKPLQAKI